MLPFLPSLEASTHKKLGSNSPKIAIAARRLASEKAGDKMGRGQAGSAPRESARSGEANLAPPETLSREHEQPEDDSSRCCPRATRFRARSPRAPSQKATGNQALRLKFPQGLRKREHI